MEKTKTTKAFRFKEFVIEQEKAAMKVGFDGVLLACWAQLCKATNILDVGTGTGLLCLMAAQRNPNAKITGIEIDNSALQDASKNINHSKWANRIQLMQCDFTNCNIQSKFDYIISNPPFYNEDTSSPEKNRHLARHCNSLPLEKWLNKASSLLMPEGVIGFIYPSHRTNEILDIAGSLQLHIKRMCNVHPNYSKPSHRVLVELSKIECLNPSKSSIALREEKSNQYSSAFKELSKDFYL